MRFYRVSYSTVLDGHAGYTFHGSKAMAERSAGQFLKGRADETPSADVEVIEVSKLTRQAVLDLLRRYGSHAENG